MKFFIDNNYLEFTISLFTRCNLRCGFCAQKHDTDLNTHELLSIPDKVLSTYMIEKVNRPNINKVGIRVWGGELFSDDIPDEYFRWYRVLRERIEDKFQNYEDIELNFLYTTNATFTKVNRVLQLLKPGDGLAVSYDPTLRYSGSVELDQRVRDNIRTLHEYVPVTVGIVLTKPTLEYYMGNFQEFISLCNSPSIDSIVFNYYIPNEGWKEHMPSDELLGEFMLRCLTEELYKIDNLKVIKTSFENNRCVSKECECKFLPNIFNNEPTKNCVKCFSNLPQSMFYGSYLSQLKDISGSQVENISETKAFIGADKRGCFECTWASICPGMCWSSIIFEGYRATSCPLKQCYVHLSNS